MSSIPIALSREDLISRLKALLPAAEKADAKALAKHQKDEAAYLVAFRAACREAIKWDYETAKDHSFYPRVSERQRNGAPSCPVSRVSKIERYLAEIDHTTQKRFTLSEYGTYSGMYALLTEDIKPTRGLC